MKEELLLGIVLFLLSAVSLFMGIKIKFKPDPTLTNFRLILFGVLGILLGLYLVFSE